MACEGKMIDGARDKIPISQFIPEVRTLVENAIGNDSCVDSNAEKEAAYRALKKMIMGKITKENVESESNKNTSQRQTCYS